MPQPNPIQQSNLPGVAIGDVSNDNTLPPPSPGLVVTSLPAEDGQVPVFTGVGPQTAPSAGSGATLLNGSVQVGVYGYSGLTLYLSAADLIPANDDAPVLGASSSVTSGADGIVIHANSEYGSVTFTDIPETDFNTWYGVLEILIASLDGTSRAVGTVTGQTEAGDTELTIGLGSLTESDCIFTGDELSWTDSDGGGITAESGMYSVLVVAHGHWY